MSAGSTRFSDRDEPQQYLRQGRVLVRCPRCADCAVASSGRVTCLSCGYAKEYAPETRPGAPCYAGLELWLQTPCRGRVLWAYNAEHLDFLERYVRAFIREREPNRNGSLASRLPAWLKDAKNRDAVLGCCATLRVRLRKVACYEIDAGQRRVADSDHVH